MIFKDRQDAAERLYKLLKTNPFIKGNKQIVVVSLLRGGVVIGDVLAKKLHAGHRALLVTKIPAPGREELAIGALCFDVTYLERSVIEHMKLGRGEVQKQIRKAQEKFAAKQQIYELDKYAYQVVQGKTIIVVDDGIATGASAKAALLFLKSFQPLRTVFATPVGPLDIRLQGFDSIIMLHQPEEFYAVSEFYKEFPQVTDYEVKELIQ